MTYTTVLHRALHDGALLVVLLTTVILGSLRWNAEMWLNDYPPDIRDRYGPMSDRTKKQRAFCGVLFLLATLGPIGYGLVWLARHPTGPPDFVQAFVYVLVAFTIFNLWDLVVLDWFIFVLVQPRFIVLPGTEGMAGYKDYFFHFRAFLIGLTGTVVFAALLAGGVVLFAG